MSKFNSRRNCNKCKSKSYDGPILSFKTSKLNKSKITGLFKGEDDNKVKEYINVYQNRDLNECLVLLYKQVIDLGDLYIYWGSLMKNLGQILSHALSREHQTKWNAILAAHKLGGPVNMLPANIFFGGGTPNFSNLLNHQRK
jgi:hypothetical protein